MLELKGYQEATLNAFSRWLEALEQARQQSEVGIAALRASGWKFLTKFATSRKPPGSG